MSKIHFEKKFAANFEKLFKSVLDFESYPKYMPNQLESVKILRNDTDGILTEEHISFSTIIKKTIIQQTLHNCFYDSIHSKIISGPAKNTEINIKFEKTDEFVNVIVDIELKLSFSSKILEPLIKKYYKSMFSAFLNRLYMSTI